MDEIIKELGLKIDAMKTETVSKADYDALKLQLETLKGGATTEDLEILKNNIEELAEKLAEKEGFQVNESPEIQLKNALIENHEKIKQIAKDGSGIIEITIKAVADITTVNGINTAPPTITGVQQAPISNVNYRNLDLTSLTTSVSTSLSAYPYTETVPKDGDYSFLGEGEIKPQVDFTWETNYAKPVKAAAWVRLTDESVQDIVGLESIARDLLFKKHNIKKAKGILFGDGILPNPKGATTYGRIFVAGDLAFSVTKPNFTDVVNACITNIATTHNYEDEMPYMANLVMVNPNDFFIQLVSAKDDNGLPLYPSASLFNTVVIGGVTIIPEETIPAGKIFVADMSKYNSTNYLPYTVKVGFVNDDFIKNQFVILGESRFHAFVKKLDEQAFIYDDIQTIKDAITAP